MVPRTKLSTHELMAAATELPDEERRAVAAALRREDVGDDEAVAEVTMASAVRMLDSSCDVLEGVLASAARVNDELGRGWF